MSRSRMAAGMSLAKHVCREIGRQGMSHVLTAKYIPDTNKLRVGIPTRHGSLDCCIDYPAELGSVQKIKTLVTLYAATHSELRPGRRAA